MQQHLFHDKSLAQAKSTSVIYQKNAGCTKFNQKQIS